MRTRWRSWARQIWPSRSEMNPYEPPWVEMCSDTVHETRLTSASTKMTGSKQRCAMLPKRYERRHAGRGATWVKRSTTWWAGQVFGQNVRHTAVFSLGISFVIVGSIYDGSLSSDVLIQCRTQTHRDIKFTRSMRMSCCANLDLSRRKYGSHWWNKDLGFSRKKIHG